MVRKSVYVFNGKEKIYILLLTMDKTGKRRYIYFYLPWTKRARVYIYTFTYHGQNGQEKTYILLHTMDKTDKRRHKYFYLPWTKRAREDIYTFTYHGQNGW
jgi:uncharacterized protein YrzB (UPF0473 family)